MRYCASSGDGQLDKKESVINLKNKVRLKKLNVVYLLGEQEKFHLGGRSSFRDGLDSVSRKNSSDLIEGWFRWLTVSLNLGSGWKVFPLSFKIRRGE